ncbi:Integrin alpha-6 [Portunus trituberculatus]|uniref:Integrin alpha-6 n=1 Tax=Portunus trituberculatus TaxID=210409 RepID=A0A5B7FT74_PORTR|nr:Integrin alpha-6 [Portunus trituberculatus]
MATSASALESPSREGTINIPRMDYSTNVGPGFLDTSLNFFFGSFKAELPLAFCLCHLEGPEEAQGTVVTYIQPDTLRAKGIPWWVILLAVLGGLLLLGLLAYGMYKSGFFKREKMEEMKAQQASVVPSNSYGTSNPGYQ